MHTQHRSRVLQFTGVCVKQVCLSKGKSNSFITQKKNYIYIYVYYFPNRFIDKKNGFQKTIISWYPTNLFVVKFNKIQNEIYRQYLIIVKNDITSCLEIFVFFFFNHTYSILTVDQVSDDSLNNF